MSEPISKSFLISIRQFLTVVFIPVIAVLIIDFIFYGEFWGPSRDPVMDTTNLMRTALIAIVSLLMVIWVIKTNQCGPTRKISYSTTVDTAEWGWITVTSKTFRIMMGMVFFFALVLIITFYLDQELFRDLSSDAKSAENFSALFSFIASFIFLFIGFTLRGNKQQHAIYYPALAWFFSALFFVIAMEEISWAQQLLHFETPEMFQGNIVNETNIHNYATHHFELAYYLSTFLMFIVVPFLNDKKNLLERLPVISFFAPSRYALYIGAIAAAYNYDLWENLFFQISFFASMFILIYYAWIDKTDDLRIILGILIVLCVFSQVSYLVIGLDFRNQAVKEYKEMFIPITFFFYALEIRRRAKLLQKR